MWGDDHVSCQILVFDMSSCVSEICCELGVNMCAHSKVCGVLYSAFM